MIKLSQEGIRLCRRRELGETQSYVSDRLLRVEEVLESPTKREERERREVDGESGGLD